MKEYGQSNWKVGSVDQDDVNEIYDVAKSWVVLTDKTSAVEKATLVAILRTNKMLEKLMVRECKINCVNGFKNL